jgi:hypothetical protein
LRLPLDHAAIDSALLAGRHAMMHSAVMGRTAVVKQLGGYWAFPNGEEYDLMLRIGEVSRLANLDQVLMHWRVHEASLTGRKMGKARLYIDYACESARRRRAKTAPISFDEFLAARSVRPAWRKFFEAVSLYARCQYRIALAELFGGRRIRGMIRLGWAAVCSPRLTVERLVRMLRGRMFGSSATSSNLRHVRAARTSSPTPSSGLETA